MMHLGLGQTERRTRMEASTNHRTSGSLVAAAETALAVCAGRVAGLAMAGETIALADRSGALLFGLAFLGAIARGRQDLGDPGLRLARDVITALGTAAVFWLVPGLMRI